jgi:hypothetical protein
LRVPHAEKGFWLILFLAFRFREQLTQGGDVQHHQDWHSETSNGGKGANDNHVEKDSNGGVEWKLNVQLSCLLAG